MFPVQPFYSSVNKLQLNFAISRRRPDVVSYRGYFSTTPESHSHQTLVLVHFTLDSMRSAFDGRTATITVNGKEFRCLPFTMVNITQLLYRLPANDYSLSFEAIPRHIKVNVYELKKTYEEDLLYAMEDTDPYARKREDTLALVQAYWAGRDNDMEVVQVSLACPLAHRKIRLPCRGVLCRHLQCFDAFAYLAWNEATLQPSWRCPVCNDQVLVHDIRVDLLTLDILGNVAYECFSVVIWPNGSWKPVAL